MAESSGNVTDYEKERITLLVEQGFLSLHFLTGLATIVFNGIFIAAVNANQSLRTTENVLLIKLSCFDVLAGVSVLLNSTAAIFPRVPLNVCLLSAFIIGIAFLGSMYSLLGVTIERYVKVCHPFLYLRLANRKTITAYMVGEGLFLVLFVTAMSLLAMAQITDGDQAPARRCMPLRFADQSPVAQVMINILIALPLLVSTVVYLRLAWIARKQRATIRTLTVVPSCQTGERDGKLADAKLPSERRRLNMVGIILFMHYVSLVPTLLNSFVVSMARISLTLAVVSKAIRELSNAFVYLNSVINPVIYAFRNHEIKMAILKLLKRT